MSAQGLSNPREKPHLDQIWTAAVGVVLVSIVAGKMLASVFLAPALPAGERAWVRADATHCVLMVTTEATGWPLCQQ